MLNSENHNSSMYCFGWQFKSIQINIVNINPYKPIQFHMLRDFKSTQTGSFGLLQINLHVGHGIVHDFLATTQFQGANYWMVIIYVCNMYIYIYTHLWMLYIGGFLYRMHMNTLLVNLKQVRNAQFLFSHSLSRWVRTLRPKILEGPKLGLFEIQE